MSRLLSCVCPEIHGLHLKVSRLVHMSGVFPRVFPGFSQGFPGVFPGFSQSFLRVFPGFAQGFQWFSQGFPRVFLGFFRGLPGVFQGFSLCFPEDFPGFSLGFPGVSGVSRFLILHATQKKWDKSRSLSKIRQEIWCLLYAGFLQYKRYALWREVSSPPGTRLSMRTLLLIDWTGIGANSVNILIETTSKHALDISAQSWNFSQLKKKCSLKAAMKHYVFLHTCRGSDLVVEIMRGLGGVWVVISSSLHQWTADISSRHQSVL